MGKLAASILSADLPHLAEEVKLVEPHADIIHVDIMDGHFVPPITTLGTVVVASLRPCTGRTLHGHLMVDAPESYFEELAEDGLDVVSFHQEAVGDPEPVPYLEQVDDVMLMSIRPGWSGQELNPDVYRRIEAVRNEVDRRGLSIDVEIDGGVKVENAQRAVDAGATVLVSASGIIRATDKVEAAHVLSEIARRGRGAEVARRERD
jgi:ribulose-phosphate 3-epimerase